ncbi:hypothetical protein A8C56_08685 [Niabella ginsenosidivorans]|uniref:Protein kinase domain-containing protein n=1 Tax=Niabella ginsenosidivorans TaxID=1176587 RepID=A0A1A9I397_9BACT|nr:hypothetical protein [Niabella ginsenosidivorans]ANH81044.1 hypothetical protein A8C56_08685 [Niabella ginsenosidivorans]
MELHQIGQENRVYFAGDHVLKVGYNYLKFYETPIRFLDNKIALHNYLFPDTRLELTGFTHTYDTNNENAIVFAPIFKQRYVKGNVLSFSEVDAFQEELVRRGFTNWAGPALYTGRDYIIKDMHIDNIMLTDQRNYRFIDTVPFLNTPELGYGGTREYGDAKVRKIPV